LSEVWQNLNK